jgi:prolipoprotein diacylglyceryl transferase
MYPDFSYLFHDLFGSNPDNGWAILKTFGFFLFLAFIASGYVLSLEFKRKERQGRLKPITVTPKKSAISQTNRDTIINTVLAFFMGFKLPFIKANFAAFKQDPASVIFSSGGNWVTGLLAGAIFGAILYTQGKKIKPITEPYQVQPHQKLGDIVAMAAIFGILGAKIFAVLENLDAFWADPVGTFFSGSGLTVLGGFIMAAAAIMIYVHRLGFSVWEVADAASPAIITGYAVGRMGCQFSGDGDWGKVNELAKPDWFIFPDWAWAYSYPHNVNRQGVKMPDCDFTYCYELVPGVWPTPIYEILMLTVIFAILWFFRTRINIPGFLFFMYFLLYGIMRFLIEFIRVNDQYEMLGFHFSQAQYISILFWFIGIGGMVFLWMRKGSGNRV